MVRRGQPETIRTGNGTHFKRVEIELFILLKDLNLAKIKTYLTNKGVKSKFNPPSSPWMVSSWESIVSTIKRSLKLVLKDRSVHEEPLRTFLVALEFTFNSLHHLPLSYDINGVNPLTPNNFLIGTQSSYFKH